jgi:hypothetical protein
MEYIRIFEEIPYFCDQSRSPMEDIASLVRGLACSAWQVSNMALFLHGKAKKLEVVRFLFLCLFFFQLANLRCVGK